MIHELRLVDPFCSKVITVSLNLGCWVFQREREGARERERERDREGEKYRKETK